MVHAYHIEERAFVSLINARVQILALTLLKWNLRSFVLAQFQITVRLRTKPPNSKIVVRAKVARITIFQIEISEKSPRRCEKTF
ncbi:MAG: hypothetical protein GY858_04175 [Candidatus Omnitrophica bacterium]|nr:hypothetical protein [Candidatus Omnitrophota bacterium]